MAETKADSNGTKKPELSKIEAVRLAWGKLGKKATAAKIMQVVRDDYGVDITLKHVYNCQSEIRKQNKKKASKVKKSKAAATPAAVPAVARTQPTPAKPVAAAAAGFDLKDLEIARGLLERFGPKKLHDLITFLAD
jgi:hypothetical protein